MTPDDIRKLYASETAASSAEAKATEAEMLKDPAMARQLLLTLYSLGGESAEFAELLNLIVKVGSMQLVAMKAHEDDDFALRMAQLIVEGMQQISAVASRPRVQRGRRGRTVRSA